MSDDLDDEVMELAYGEPSWWAAEDIEMTCQVGNCEEESADGILCPRHQQEADEAERDHDEKEKQS